MANKQHHLRSILEEELEGMREEYTRMYEKIQDIERNIEEVEQLHTDMENLVQVIKGEVCVGTSCTFCPFFIESEDIPYACLLTMVEKKCHETFKVRSIRDFEEEDEDNE